MFDLGYQELLVLAALAIIVIGPKDLPHFLRTMGKYFRQIKRQVTDIQREVTKAIDTEEMRSLRDDVKSIGDINRPFDSNTNSKNASTSSSSSTPTLSNDDDGITSSPTGGEATARVRKFVPKPKTSDDGDNKVET